MFGFNFFAKEPGDNYVTPRKFQEQATHDIQDHLRKIHEQGGFEELRKRRQRQHLSAKKLLGLQKHKKQKQAQRQNDLQSVQQQQQRQGLQLDGKQSTESSPLAKDHISYMPYGSSPLRKSVSVDSSDQSSIDSGSSISSGMSASQVSLSRQASIMTNGSSIFSTVPELARIYTNSTVPTTIDAPMNGIPSSLEQSGNLSLNEALPKDFSDYYAPGLEAERFSNGRPVFTKRNLRCWELNDIRSLLIYERMPREWHGKVPEVISPYSEFVFRIQLISLWCSDEEFADCLAHSDIYRESKFGLEFRVNTARYILQRARLRHKSILETNFSIPQTAFNPQTNLVGDIQYDAYFKFEWRNVIENYLLNLAIENQCRHDFKERVSKIKRINKHSQNCYSAPSNDLYKKVLAHNNSVNLDNNMKQQIWQDVQKSVYGRLELGATDLCV